MARPSGSPHPRANGGHDTTNALVFAVIHILRRNAGIPAGYANGIRASRPVAMKNAPARKRVAAQLIEITLKGMVAAQNIPLPAIGLLASRAIPIVVVNCQRGFRRNDLLATIAFRVRKSSGYQSALDPAYRISIPRTVSGITPNSSASRAMSSSVSGQPRRRNTSAPTPANTARTAEAVRARAIAEP